jgi:serine/threonine protein kinase
LFEKEKRTFLILNEKQEQHPNIIKYFGSFIHHDSTGALTYNLVLENAQCDLVEYFADTAPPTTPCETNWYWRQMMGVAEALQTIHQRDRHFGWHADVKPDNVLYADDTFKLADFGLSKFVERNHNTVVEEVMDGGTAMYNKSELFGCRW